MNPLDALFADLIETIGNAALGLNADAKERLADLEGQSIRIECTLPSKVATLQVCGGRIAVSAEALGEADAVVRGSIADLITWMVAGASADSAAVRIEGDLGAWAEIAAAIAPHRIGWPFDALPSGTVEDLLGAVELALAGLRSATEGAARAIEQERKSHPDGLSPLAQLTPAFEALRAGVLTLALKAQELTKPARGDPS